MLDIFPIQRVCGVTVLLMGKTVLFQPSGVLECSKSLSDRSYMDANICKNSSSVYLRLRHFADFTAYVIFFNFFIMYNSSISVPCPRPLGDTGMCLKTPSQHLAV